MNLENQKVIELPGTMPPPPTSTVVRREPSPPRPRRNFEPLEKALLSIDQKAIAYRYVSELLLDPATVEAVEGAISAVLAQRKVIESHSPVLQAEKTREAEAAYSAPGGQTKENLKALRESQTLNFWQHARTQHAAQSRLGEIVREQIAPLMPELYTKTATLLEADGKYCEISDANFYKNFGLKVPVHPMAQSLYATATLFRRMASYAATSREMPGFLENLLAAYKNTSRPKPDLIGMKMILAQFQKQSAQQAEAAPEDAAVEVGMVAVETN